MARSFERLPLTDPRAFICECGRDGCAGRAYLTLDEYRAVRAQPEQLVTARGHEPARRRVVAQNDRFSIVVTPGPDLAAADVGPARAALLPSF